MNKRELRKAYDRLENGAVFYVNAINCTAGAIQLLRELIERREVRVNEPDMAIMKEEYKDEFRSGRMIAPQMGYVKTGEAWLALGARR